MPPHAPSLSHRGPGSFDTFTQQRPASQAGTAHCRPVLARLRRPPHQPPFVCADGAGRPANPLGAPSPSHFAPPAFDTSVGHPTIHPSTPVSTRRSLPRLLRPPPHDQIGMSRRPTRPQPRRWLFCAVPLLPEVARHPLSTLRHRFAPPRTPGPRSSPRHAAACTEPQSRPATFGTAPDNPSMQQPPCDGSRRRDTSPYDSPSEEKYILAPKRPQCPPCAPARSSRVPPPPHTEAAAVRDDHGHQRALPRPNARGGIRLDGTASRPPTGNP